MHNTITFFFFFFFSLFNNKPSTSNPVLGFLQLNKITFSPGFYFNLPHFGVDESVFIFSQLSFIHSFNSFGLEVNQHYYCAYLPNMRRICDVFFLFLYILNRNSSNKTLSLAPILKKKFLTFVQLHQKKFFFIFFDSVFRKKIKSRIIKSEISGKNDDEKRNPIIWI